MSFRFSDEVCRRMSADKRMSHSETTDFIHFAPIDCLIKNAAKLRSALDKKDTESAILEETKPISVPGTTAATREAFLLRLASACRTNPKACDLLFHYEIEPVTEWCFRIGYLGKNAAASKAVLRFSQENHHGIHSFVEKGKAYRKRVTRTLWIWLGAGMPFSDEVYSLSPETKTWFLSQAETFLGLFSLGKDLVDSKRLLDWAGQSESGKDAIMCAFRDAKACLRLPGTALSFFTSRGSYLQKRRRTDRFSSLHNRIILDAVSDGSVDPAEAAKLATRNWIPFRRILLEYKGTQFAEVWKGRWKKEAETNPGFAAEMLTNYGLFSNPQAADHELVLSDSFEELVRLQGHRPSETLVRRWIDSDNVRDRIKAINALTLHGLLIPLHVLEHALAREPVASLRKSLISLCIDHACKNPEAIWSATSVLELLFVTQQTKKIESIPYRLRTIISKTLSSFPHTEDLRFLAAELVKKGLINPTTVELFPFVAAISEYRHSYPNDWVLNRWSVHSERLFTSWHHAHSKSRSEKPLKAELFDRTSKQSPILLFR